MCIHGFNVNVKGKMLKRPTQVVKHSRYLKNMVLTPVFPEPVQAAPVTESKPVMEDNTDE